MKQSKPETTIQFTTRGGAPSDEADRAQVDRLLADEQVVDAPVEELHLRDERAHVEDPRVERQDVAVRDAQRRALVLWARVDTVALQPVEGDRRVVRVVELGPAEEQGVKKSCHGS